MTTKKFSVTAQKIITRYRMEGDMPRLWTQSIGIKAFTLFADSLTDCKRIALALIKTCPDCRKIGQPYESAKYDICCVEV